MKDELLKLKNMIRKHTGRKPILPLPTAKQELKELKEFRIWLKKLETIEKPKRLSIIIGKNKLVKKKL